MHLRIFFHLLAAQKRLCLAHQRLENHRLPQKFPKVSIVVLKVTCML